MFSHGGELDLAWLVSGFSPVVTFAFVFFLFAFLFVSYFFSSILSMMSEQEFDAMFKGELSEHFQS